MTYSIQQPKFRPKLLIRFITYKNEIVPMPSFEDWESAVLNVVDSLVEVSNSYPRIESKIFGQWEGIVHTHLRVC